MDAIEIPSRSLQIPEQPVVVEPKKRD